MVVILLSYFSTMVTVFAALMFLLVNVFGSVPMHQARAASHHMSATARAMASERYAAAQAKQAEVAQLQIVVPSPALPQKTPVEANGEHVTHTAARQAQKAKLARLARNAKQRERLAERRQDRDYSTLAMGYVSEPREQLASAHLFDTIGSIRTPR
jgi:hypothetical protein